MRATISVMPPAPVGTTMRIGFAGQACARTLGATASDNSATLAVRLDTFIVSPPPKAGMSCVPGEIRWFSAYGFGPRFIRSPPVIALNLPR